MAATVTPHFTVLQDLRDQGVTSWVAEYLTNDSVPGAGATALSLTPDTGTQGSGNTQSATFVEARTFTRTVGTSYLSGPAYWQIQVDMASVTGPYEYRFQLHRLDSGGSVLASSEYSQVDTDPTLYRSTIYFDPGTWAPGDQLRVSWEHRRPSGTGNKNGTINTTADSFVSAPDIPDVADPMQIILIVGD